MYWWEVILGFPFIAMDWLGRHFPPSLIVTVPLLHAYSMMLLPLTMLWEKIELYRYKRDNK
jgi:hypothetical protein